MNDPQMRAAMEKANNGEEVKSPLNQTRHSQKTSKDSIRNGDYTVRMVAVASMHVAAKMMGMNINTKKPLHEHTCSSADTQCISIGLLSHNCAMSSTMSI